MCGSNLKASQNSLEILPLPGGALAFELGFESFYPQALVFVFGHLPHVVDRRYTELY